MPTLWPHVPTSFSEVLEFSTDVKATREGEFRTINKDATQRPTLGHHFQDAEAARADGLYRSAPLGEWYVPQWPYASRIAGTISAGTDTIEVNANADWRDGGQACIIQDDRTAEVVTIVTVSGGLLYIESPGVVGNYIGTVNKPIIVAPVLTAICPEGLQRADRVSIAETAMPFIVTNPADLSASIYPTHRTFDVVTDVQAVLQPIARGISQRLDLIESGFGSYAMEPEETYERARGAFQQVRTTADGRWNLITWLHRMAGRDGAFWMPSWKDDLPLQASLGASTTTFRTQKTSPVVTDLVGRSIQFRLPNGTTIHREITGAASVSDTEMDLTIAAPGQAVSVLSVVSLMDLARFDSDTIEVQHQVSADGYVSTVTAPIVEVVA